jgi:cytochrome c oxidase subunit 4
MVLTGVTVAAAFVNLGSFNFPVAIAIAITKATLVILFFMHVKYSSRLTKMVVAMSFFFLAIMFGLTLSDYMSRGWYASPRGSTGAGTQVGISVNTPARTETPRPAEPAAEPAR